METPVELNPAQQEVVEMLGASRAERPVFQTTLRTELSSAVEQGLEPLLERAAKIDDTIWVSKHALGQVMGCERKYLAEEEAQFEWSVPLARGSISHKAIELSIHWRREPEPLALVDEALSRLTEGDDSLGDWLQTTSETERAELRAESNDRVVKFMECFPPLKAQWRPVTESRLRLEVHDCFVFSGKVDLTLGHPEGTRAGKVLIDLKTGGFSPQHLEDLRFYALIETIRLGTPPRRIATYYLDQGSFVPEDMTEDVLFAAAARLIDGTTKIVELLASAREPNLVVGPICRWCPVLVDCEAGRRHLDEDIDDSDW
ncbi:MAG: PD-(D/E)XK nuclease family protein [Acidimicrobiaceae bacterium]|nr:PD-(D/E)XK nuclease family protein [Acidimicrobiaceae bacterium]MXW76038.1 PD-(D/E)XK nuclease family protein [Acidimicrobiaceae bacterium]MYC43274.1 PD-(D/E)XK nuclease family protein [Acidimicrobiaceae bacterium]MYD06179.1 PD-(D/E)XK nuclease family protein [Acidimicrobiaceae bacterium]MYI57425.1 PD-(D/E)XK nuclease family protein [Acidimicrobiaceae bacterium]